MTTSTLITSFKKLKQRSNNDVSVIGLALKQQLPSVFLFPSLPLMFDPQMQQQCLLIRKTLAARFAYKLEKALLLCSGPSALQWLQFVLPALKKFLNTRNPTSILFSFRLNPTKSFPNCRTCPSPSSFSKNCRQ